MSSAASPTALFIRSSEPVKVSACATACPPNLSAKLPTNESSLSVEPTAPFTSIPYLVKALVDDPIVLLTKSAAPAKSNPFAADKSSTAGINFLISSSSSVNAAMSA